MDSVDVSQLPHHSLKDLGNRSYAEGHYQDAISFYSFAIKKQPNVSSYFSNRALSFVQLHKYHEALSDCKRAIDLDENNLKAYFFAGQAHVGLEQWDEALVHLMHAHNLAQAQRRNFGDDITSVMRLAKRKRFEAFDEKRRREEIDLQVYLNNLILQDADRQKKAFLCGLLSQDSVADGNTSTTVVHCSQSSTTKSPTNPEPVPICTTGQRSSFVQVHTTEHTTDSYDQVTVTPAIEDHLNLITDTAQRRISELNDLFGQVDSRRQKREVPEYLCGRISFELMLDPVITPSGITYDRPSIIAHLRKVGHFDPLTRQSLTESQLIPNLSMKEVVHAFLEQNPWADSY